MKAFLKLIRIQNLFIIAGTQYLMRWAIIHPLLRHSYGFGGEEIKLLTGFDLQFNEFYFFLLVLSTIFLTAAGYVINDYFDTKTDILIVGKVNRNKLKRLINKFRKEMDKRIRYTVMSKKEFEYRNDLTDKFLYHILENRKIVITDKIFVK